MALNRGFTLWFTGLPGSGKTTAARLVARRLLEDGARVEVLDGDVVRKDLSSGLGFSKEDRDENIRRIGFVCELLSRNGVVAIPAVISPYRAARESVRKRTSNFIEVYMKCPLPVLIKRDPKGLYKKALSGELPHFTGVSDPYEEPLEPELTIHSDREGPEETLERIWDVLLQRELVRTNRSLTVANQRIAQKVPQRAEPGLVVPPLKKPLPKNRLTDLL
jgi:adenylyl-sulfate kinase